MRRKAEVQAPMASANDRIAAVEVTFRFINWRQPKMTSARWDSSQAMRRRSRLASRICRAEPKAWRTSAGSRPSRMPSARCEPSSSSISRSTRLPRNVRSEEHTSELQSLAYLVCRLLLEKKKKKKKKKIYVKKRKKKQK